MNGWISRNADLIKSTKINYIEHARHLPSLQSRCEAFYSILEEYRSIIHFHPDIIINVDETRIDSHKCQSKKTVVISSEVGKVNLSNMKYRQSRSLITFVNASGNVLLNVLVSPTTGEIGKEKIVSIPMKTKPSIKGDVLNRMYAWNKSGWVSKQIWLQSVNKFIKIMKTLFNGRRVVLILDRLAAHLDLEILSLLLKNNIYTFFIPTKSSHLVQPLDQLIFANFKKVLRQKIWNFQTTHGYNVKVPIDNLIMESEVEAFTPQVVKKSFEVVGLMPFNIEKMKAKVSKFLLEKGGKLIETNDDSSTDRIKKMMKSILLAEHSKEKTMKISTEKVIQKNGEVYSVYELQARTLKIQKEKKEKQLKAEELKIKKRKEREKKRKEREEMRRRRIDERKKKRERNLVTVNVKTEERLKNMCSICHKIYRKGKDWKICSFCMIWKVCGRSM